MIFYHKNGIMVRSTIEQDIDEMKNKLRRSDINEIWASDHVTPEEALKRGHEESLECFTISIKGTPVAMFGIDPQTLLGDYASIWFLATDDLTKIRKSFIKECRRFINLMLSQYPVLFNYVDARNKESIQWLKWCGANIEEAKSYGVDGLPFHYFTFRRALCV